MYKIYFTLSSRAACISAISSASSSRSRARKQPGEETGNEAAGAKLVNANGIVRTSPAASLNHTRQSPHRSFCPRTSNRWRYSGWNGCVTTNVSSLPSDGAVCCDDDERGSNCGGAFANPGQRGFAHFGSGYAGLGTSVNEWDAVEFKPLSLLANGDPKGWRFHRDELSIKNTAAG